MMQALIEWFAALNPQSLARISEFYADDVEFFDPFNAVRGRAAVTAIFAHMFVEQPQARFEIVQAFQQGHHGFASWNFYIRLFGRPHVIHGATHFEFDAGGLVIRHRDYWDSSVELWMKIPLLGLVLRCLHRRLAAPQTKERSHE